MSDEPRTPAPAGEDPPDDQAVPDVSADPTEVSAIEAEAWGVKVRVPFRPAPAGGKPPTSWKQVGRAVNRRLMAIVEGLFGVAQDVVLATRAVIRGTAKMLPEPAAKVRQAHQKAERKEGLKQEQVESEALTPPPASVPQGRIEDLILRKRADGYEAAIVDLGGDRVVVVFVKPGELDVAVQLGDKALPVPDVKKVRRRRTKPKDPGGGGNS